MDKIIQYPGFSTHSHRIRLSLKGCSPAEPFFVSPDGTKINSLSGLQLRKWFQGYKEWGVLYWVLTLQYLSTLKVLISRGNLSASEGPVSVNILTKHL